jgi:hypothetical protein
MFIQLNAIDFFWDREFFHYCQTWNVTIRSSAETEAITTTVALFPIRAPVMAPAKLQFQRAKWEYGNMKLATEMQFQRFSQTLFRRLRLGQSLVLIATILWFSQSHIHEPALPLCMSTHFSLIPRYEKWKSDSSFRAMALHHQGALGSPERLWSVSKRNSRRIELQLTTRTFWESEQILLLGESEFVPEDQKTKCNEDTDGTSCIKTVVT